MRRRIATCDAVQTRRRRCGSVDRQPSRAVRPGRLDRHSPGVRRQQISDQIRPFHQANAPRIPVFGRPQRLERLGTAQPIGVEMIDRQIGLRTRESGRTSGLKTTAGSTPSGPAIAFGQPRLARADGPTRPITVPGVAIARRSRGRAASVSASRGDVDDQAVVRADDQHVVTLNGRIRRVAESARIARRRPAASRPGRVVISPTRYKRDKEGAASRRVGVTGEPSGTSSKSSPSFRAWSSAVTPGRAAHGCVASSWIGMAASSRIAPSPPLSSRMWPRSEDRPSEMSISGMDVGRLVQGERFTNRAARAAGGGRASCRRAGRSRGPRRPTWPRATDLACAVVSPSKVTAITSGPSQALVSPPTRATPNRSASDQIPAMQSPRRSRPACPMPASATRRPPPRRTAARPSPRCPERFTPIALCRPPRPVMPRAGNGGRPSACPSSRQVASAPARANAASSPMPSTIQAPEDAAVARESSG